MPQPRPSVPWLSACPGLGPHLGHTCSFYRLKLGSEAPLHRLPASSGAEKIVSVIERDGALLISVLCECWGPAPQQAHVRCCELKSGEKLLGSGEQLTHLCRVSLLAADVSEVSLYISLIRIRLSHGRCCRRGLHRWRVYTGDRDAGGTMGCGGRKQEQQVGRHCGSQETEVTVDPS